MNYGFFFSILLGFTLLFSAIPISYSTVQEFSDNVTSVSSQVLIEENMNDKLTDTQKDKYLEMAKKSNF